MTTPDNADELQDLTQRVAALEEGLLRLMGQVSGIEESLKVRSRPKKESLPNICALNRELESSLCEDATVYRYQQGCRGVACVRSYRDYYEDYRKRENELDNPDEDTVG